MTLVNEREQPSQMGPPPVPGEKLPRGARVIEVDFPLGGKPTVDVPKATVYRGELIVWRAKDEVTAFSIVFAQEGASTEPTESLDGSPASCGGTEVRSLSGLARSSVALQQVMLPVDKQAVEKEYRYALAPVPPPVPPPGLPPPIPIYPFSIIIREPKKLLE